MKKHITKIKSVFKKILANIKSNKEKIYKIFDTLRSVICWVMIACLAVTLVVFFITRVTGNVPSVLGYSVYRVSSGSMEPELSIGDVILSKDVKDPQEIKVGDVITFEGEGQFYGKKITHEVVKAPYINESGECMLQTKGTVNATADPEIKADSVISIMITELSFLPTLYNFFLSPAGFIIFIGSLFLIFIDEVINIVKILTGNEKTEKDADDINEIIGRISAESKKENIDENCIAAECDDNKLDLPETQENVE